MINESKLNNRMLHLMESGFFGKQLLNEGALNISENMKVRIFQAVYNYWMDKSNKILVDGIAGEQTAKVLNNIKQEDKHDYESKSWNDYLKSDYRYGLGKLTYSIGKKTFNIGNIHDLRMLQVLLFLSGYTEVKPDGIMGPITKDAMKAKLDTDDITKVTKEKLDTVREEAIKNVEEVDMTFKIEGFDAGTGGNAGKSGEQNAEEKKEPTLDKSVTVRNETDVDVWIAWAYKNTHLGANEKSFTSQGWLNLTPVSVATLPFPNIKEIFIYGQVKDQDVDGIYPLCVKFDVSDFKIDNANEKSCSIIKKFNLIKSANVTFFTNNEGKTDISFFGKTPKAEKAKKEKEFNDGLLKIKEIVKNYTYKYGTFVVNDPESISAGISFYDTNFFGQSNFIGEAKYPSSEFMKKAYELGFSKEGRWIYFPDSNRLYLYSKSLKGSLSVSNAYYI